MTVEVVPFEAGCGAEIRGVDIREPLAPAERDAIRAAWLQHLVLRFREQAMSDAEHMAFTRRFGELEFNPGALIARQYCVENYSTGRRAEIPPEISVISNIISSARSARIGSPLGAIASCLCRATRGHGSGLNITLAGDRLLRGYLGTVLASSGPILTAD